MAHNGHDPGEREPLGIYWYEPPDPAHNQPEWVRHVIDYSTRTGAGIEIAVADYDNDGDMDFAVGGKSGLYLFENLTKGKKPEPRHYGLELRRLGLQTIIRISADVGKSSCTFDAIFASVVVTAMTTAAAFYPSRD